MIDLNTLSDRGVPLHACNGYRHDEHYWAWIATRYIEVTILVPKTARWTYPNIPKDVIRDWKGR